MDTLHPEAWRWREFEGRNALAKALSSEVAAALTQEVELARSVNAQAGPEIASSEEHQILAVSGGTTPKTFFNHLSRAELPWASVIVTLCDDRFVPPSSPRSNETLVRAELLRERAESARFVPLFRDVATAEEAASLGEEAFSELPQPIAVAVLGMGLDGHTASLFPDAVELAQALDPSSMAEVMAIHAPSAGEPRITRTLQALATAFHVFLHIEGAAKRSVFEQAMRTEPALPIRAVIAQAFAESGNPVQVFWAP